jgi:peptidyl-dipeptidase Dcp
MNKLVFPVVLIALLTVPLIGAANLEKSVTNPFLSEYSTPFGAPPFDEIEIDHYLPAFDSGLEAQESEILEIVDNPAPPSFLNTIEAFERSGALIDRVRSVLLNLSSADTNDEIQAIVQETQPRFARHRDDIRLNSELFDRISAVYNQKDDLELTIEQKTLLEETYRDFVRGGAELEEEKQKRLRDINQDLAVLSVQFGDNVLEEMNGPALVLDSEQELAGLPEQVRLNAAQTAKELGLEGKWVFTLQRTSWTPFLKFSERRDLRKQLYRAYMNMGNNDNEYDNKTVAARIAALRAERAQLLGYESHAHFVLERNMAQTPQRVTDLLTEVWQPALRQAKFETADIQALIDSEGGGFKAEAWDWWFYSEKVRKDKFDFDEQTLKPYFVLERVRDGAFEVANKLYGVSFEERTDVPVYHPDVRAFEVKDADGSHLGLFYVDYLTRSSKRGGAWMNNFRDQSRLDGEEIRPIVANVCNFSPPTGDGPALLSIDEARTLFHEFGHGLHGLLANGTYESLSGTNVRRDFVELPSQIMENWAMDPEVLSQYARHYETQEPIPAELIEKMEAAEKFNQGFATTEYLAASFLDLDWHSLTDGTQRDSLEFEAEALEEIGLIPEIVSRYRTTYFSHIFSGGYSSGYYSYLWAEVLDADAFEAFKSRGLFDEDLATSFRKNILEAGGTEPPMELYLRFRGEEPKIDALLERRGLGP